MTLYEKFYEFISKDIETTKEEAIVFTILSNLTDRRGLGNEFNQIDDDIKDQIIEDWIKIVSDKLSTEESEIEKIKANIENISYDYHGMGCGIEDNGITDRYQACQYGFDNAINKVLEYFP